MRSNHSTVASEVLRTAITQEFPFEELLSEVDQEWALIILWSAKEPHRVGEVALLGRNSQRWVLGRCPTEESDQEPRAEPGTLDARAVMFFRQRPDGCASVGVAQAPASPYLLGEGLSRRQLLIDVDEHLLRLTNIGRCELLINGVSIRSGAASSGMTIHLRDQLLLYCTHRPRSWSACRDFPQDAIRGFGEADVFGIVGESPTVWLLRERAALLAAGRANILILGESGTGKELTAQAIHQLSERRNRAMVSTNIAAIAPGLAPVQLFGNRKGFPESKMPESKGLVGAADGSTLFLDEIGDMPLEVQPMFLRVTEERREYQRLGEEDRPPRFSDFRLLGATNRPEKLRIELRRRFQRTIEVPRLQERREDIPLLVNHLLRECRKAGDSEAARFFSGDQPALHPLLVEYLVHYEYQTHVSEIGLLLGQAMARSRGSVILPCSAWIRTMPFDSSHLCASAKTPELGRVIQPLPIVAQVGSDQGVATPTPPILDRPRLVRELRGRIEKLKDAERCLLHDLISKSYLECNGDHTAAAASLGLNRFQLYRLLNRLNWKPVRILAEK